MEDLRQIEMVGEFLRQYAKSYVEEKKKFLGNETIIRDKERQRLKTHKATKEYSRLTKQINKIADQISDFLCAEHFVFSDVGVMTAQNFIEAQHLPISIDYYRRMVKEGKYRLKTQEGGENVNNKRAWFMEEPRMLDDSSGEGHTGTWDIGGSDGVRTSGDRDGVVDTSGQLAACGA